MGIESDQEIVQMVGSDLIDDLGPSLQRAMHCTVDTLGDGIKHPVYTQTLVCFLLFVCQKFFRFYHDF